MLLANQLEASVSHWGRFISAFCLQMCLILEVFEVFHKSVSAFHLSRTSKVASPGCPMQRQSGDGPGNQVPDASDLTKDPTGLLTDVEACPVAFGQTFVSSLSLNIQIFGPWASGISDHPLLHLQHCPARPSLGNLTCCYADTSLDAMVFPEKRAAFPYCLAKKLKLAFKIVQVVRGGGKLRLCLLHSTTERA